MPPVGRILRYLLILTLVMPVWLSLPTAGCSKRSGDLTILTLWHNYGGQLHETMEMLIAAFNATAGAREGIIINVTSISGSAAIHEKLTMAAHGAPGVSPLPDLSIVYPGTALLLAEKGLLIDLDSLFSAEELSSYIPRFLEEGRFQDGGLYVFPTAKSTEVLFLNRTTFDRFASDSGVTVQDLETFEGIFEAAALYYDWTDNQTPKTKGDGKAFFMSDSLFNYALAGCRQLGAELIDHESINFGAPQYTRIWDSYFRPAIMGRAAIYHGYATDLFKTGEIICSTGSSAGAMFYPHEVTYPDNTTEAIALEVFPYPFFKGGAKAALQRGAGMCITASTGAREKKAAAFLKWFTSPENNLRFVSASGYLPVTVEAFDTIMVQEMEAVSEETIKNLFRACRSMQAEYEFLIPPLFEGVDRLQHQYEAGFRDIATASKESYRELLVGGNPEQAYAAVAGRALAEFSNQF